MEVGVELRKHCSRERVVTSSRLRLKCDDTCAETKFRLSAKRTSPFKSAGCQFSRLLAGELYTSSCRVCTARVSLCSAVMWRLLVTYTPQTERAVPRNRCLVAELSLWGPGFSPGPVRVEFVVEKSGTRTDFTSYFVIPCCCHCTNVAHTFCHVSETALS
jgi:hypothetical protein